LRIAFFTDTYLPNTDGVVSHIQLYRRYFEQMGHEVYVFAPGTRKQKKENTDKHVYYFTSTSFKPYPDYRIALFPFLSTTRLVKEIKPDIIHSHGIAMTGIAAFQVAQNLKIPALATFHTLVSDAIHYISPTTSLNTVLSDMVWKYLRWYYKHFKVVLAPSRFAEKILRKEGIENIRVYPSGFDASRFTHPLDTKKSASVLKKYGITQPYILTLGRVAHEKNLDDVIDVAHTVMNKHPDIQFIIGGKGPALEDYKKKAETEGCGNVRFIGYVDDADLPHIYQNASLFLMPSKFDTQGLVVLEAMASGVPVIAQKGSAPAEFIKDGGLCAGLTYESVLDLAEKIDVLLDEKERQEKSRAAVELAKQYDISKKGKELLDIYEELISNSVK